MRIIAAIAVTFLAIVPGIVSAAERPCLTSGEFSALAGYAMPSVINGTTKRCSATLGPNAYLPTNGQGLAQRYAVHKDKSWSGAKAAFMKLSATTGNQTGALLKDIPDDTLQQMLDTLVEGMVSQEIPLERCAAIDGFVRLLSPLPPQNTAELIALTVGLASKAKQSKVGKLQICQN